MKLVVDADTDVVVGVHMVGDAAAEIMQGDGVGGEVEGQEERARQRGGHPPEQRGGVRDDAECDAQDSGWGRAEVRGEASVEWIGGDAGDV